MLENTVQAAGGNIWIIVLTILILVFLAILIGGIFRRKLSASRSGDVTAVPWSPALTEKKRPWRSRYKTKRTIMHGSEGAWTKKRNAGRTSMQTQRSWR